MFFQPREPVDDLDDLTRVQQQTSRRPRNSTSAHLGSLALIASLCQSSQLCKERHQSRGALQASSPRTIPLRHEFGTAVPGLWYSSARSLVPADQLDGCMAKYIEEESKRFARGNSNWKEFARLLNRDDRLMGQYCVQCNIISHARDKCELNNGEEACAKCIKSGRGCSKLIELDGVLYLGWLPLPAEARGDAQWEETAYWVSR